MQLATAQTKLVAETVKSAMPARDDVSGDTPQNIVRALSARRPPGCPAWSPFAYTISHRELIASARALHVQPTTQFALGLDRAVLFCCADAISLAELGRKQDIKDYILDVFSALARGGERAASALRRDGAVTVAVGSYLHEAFGTPSGDEGAWFVWVERVQMLAKSIIKKKPKVKRGAKADWVLDNFAAECVAIAREAGADLSLPVNDNLGQEKDLLVFARMALALVAARGMAIIEALKSKGASQSIVGYSELSRKDQINAVRIFNSYRSVSNRGLADRLARAKKAPARPLQTRLEICSRLVREVAAIQADTGNPTSRR